VTSPSPEVGPQVALEVGPVEVGSVAHGGHCVARHDGRVIFVRHALPGEQVMVRITDSSHDRFWRGDAVRVLQPSPDRVRPPCAIAGPGRCGGCDFQHVDLAAQRALKAQVVAEQLQRLGGISWTGSVEAVSTPGTEDGLGWRTRMRYLVDDQGRAGLRAHRSHKVIALPENGCIIASVATPSVVGQRWPPGAAVQAVTSHGGPALLVDDTVNRGSSQVVEHAAGRDWSVAAAGFWQVHPGAADTLVRAVLEGLQPVEGERAFDLYCGVGLFAGALADRGCHVWGIESGPAAIQAARHNLSDVADRVRLSVGRVDRRLSQLPPRADLVVLDPPRTGAGKPVMVAIARRRPRAVAYVACDPASLARDVGIAASLGYRPVSIRAFDLFPMTHHVESVAILVPTD
jgi:tRNA/tmRNA/rRNA uracil-C5-methylase (TrmA/RlmC/RlmD family)